VPVRALAGGLAWGVLLAGCFGPEPREGLRCSADGDCPPGQDCFPVAGGPEPGVCSSAAPSDAGVEADGGGDLAFSAPEEVPFMCGEAPCLSPRDPSLSADRKQIAFSVETLNAAGDRDVYLAIRPTAFDSWFPAAQAGAIDSLVVEEGSSLSASGLRLYFTRADQNDGGPPYGELLVSERVAEGDPFDNAEPVAGVVNTSNGNERAAVLTEDGARLIFARALDGNLGDHDVYVAVDGGGQWDTVTRLEAVSQQGTDERSMAIVESAVDDENLLFVTRAARILEARWSGGYIAGAEVVSMHDELVVKDAEVVSGVWVAPDGSEIWFGACGATCAIYRAVR
jgi:hypothetical protein